MDVATCRFHAGQCKRGVMRAQRRPSKNKNPAALRLTGRLAWCVVRAAYFLAAKMSFEICDLWFEAELRWMTLLLTARSSAEE